MQVQPVQFMPQQFVVTNGPQEQRASIKTPCSCITDCCCSRTVNNGRFIQNGCCWNATYEITGIGNSTYCCVSDLTMVGIRFPVCCLLNYEDVKTASLVTPNPNAKRIDFRFCLPRCCEVFCLGFICPVFTFRFCGDAYIQGKKYGYKDCCYEYNGTITGVEIAKKESCFCFGKHMKLYVDNMPIMFQNVKNADELNDAIFPILQPASSLLNAPPVSMMTMAR